MGIFGSIKNAIFGHAREAQTAATGSSTIPPVGGQIQQQPQAGQQQPVDVEAVLTQISSQKGNPDLNWRSSIVDLMKLLDLDSSLTNRKELATELGYTGAKDGSAEMNIWLHRRVMDELEKNGGLVPASLKD
ncbi:MAG TPA: DUF3597 domain-containing protein [Allosphingosinicella sp.]|nr:DUF3597 domain-containing protein [Allosphingosinicella sp.]